MTSNAMGGWVTFAQNEVGPLSRSAATTSLHIQEEMLRATMSRGNASSQILTVLKDHLGLTAAALFIRSRSLKAFTLKASSGFDYAGYRSFLLSNPSYISIACEGTAPSALIAFAPFNDTLHSMYGITEDHDVAAVLVVPIFSQERTDGDFPDPFGALCLYVPSGGDLDAVVSICRTVQNVVGPLYLSTLEKRRMHLMSEAVKIASYEGTLTGTAERLVSLICRELSFGGGSLWLLDPKRQQLQLQAAFPSIRRERGSASDNVVRDIDSRPPSSNPIALAFNCLHNIHYPHPKSADEATRHFAAFDIEKITEDYGGTFHNVVAVPLRTETQIIVGHVNRNAVGVLTLTNKYTVLGGVIDHIPTTWEDLNLVESMAQVSSALIVQRLTSLDHEADFERRIHSLKINLLSVRDTLTQLEERAQLVVPDPRMKHYLPNAIEWIREMQRQVAQNDKRETRRVVLEPVSFRAALAKSVKAAQRSASANMIELFTVDATEIFEDGRSGPQVLIDQAAFQVILRNLFENSMHYRNKRSDACSVKIWTERDEQAGLLRVHYADNGIGVPREERSQVFENGFRGSSARRVYVQGEGVGLHECKTLMQAMKGSISIEARDQEGTEFVLKFAVVT